MTGAALYFLEAGGHVSLIAPITGFEQKYSKLLAICIFVLAAGCAAFWAGCLTNRREARVGP